MAVLRALSGLLADCSLQPHIFILINAIHQARRYKDYVLQSHIFAVGINHRAGKKDLLLGFGDILQF